MKRLLLIPLLTGFLVGSAWAAQTPITTIDSPTATREALRDQANIRFGHIEANRQDHEGRIDALETEMPNKQDKVGGVTDTNISHLFGTTGNIQDQLNNKANSSHDHSSIYADRIHGHNATDVLLNTSGFSGNLSSADDTVQKAMATLDGVIGGGGTGTDGRTWLSGSGAPADGIGENGDFYLDTTAHAYYGPKAAGSWTGTGPTSLVGPAGSPGHEGPAGADGQDGAPGADGLSAYEIAVLEGFVGDEASWLASLVGPEGPPGADGTGVVAGLPEEPPTAPRQIIQAMGGCSDTQYDDQVACEANSGTWTEPSGEWVSVISGLINDEGDTVEDLLSAFEIDARIATKQDASENLTAFSNISPSPGMLAVVGAENWTSLVPGSLGDVLTSAGPGESPTWETPVGDNLGIATSTDVATLFSGSGDYLRSDGTRGTPTSGAASAATDVTVTTTNFSGNLSALDDTVQKALESLDQVTGGPVDLTAPGPIGSVTPDTGNFTTVTATGFDVGTPDIGETGEIALHEDPANGTDVVTLKAPASIDGDLVFTLPGAYPDPTFSSERWAVTMGGDGIMGTVRVHEWDEDLYSLIQSLFAGGDVAGGKIGEGIIADNITIGTLPSGRMAAGDVAKWGAVPDTASSTCTTGTVARDADYLYVCVSADTWVRAQMSTW